ncbi:hypothetical protein GCM10011571_27110 [Marinithermofilum abyssi]|uniref:LysM domain-containing protein n=1 Tax=Marinithermofilum abyssi TaxID=1571185 RepID=A0A8J2VC88_9BACL|nr:LysM peptidoglycan-binding domain-containing C40 family peptidase [Marinithermofilum abyssi]GGE23582.1 hypothetical protein GCM10011571_27110 [Marinithermofilum abyssi]
MIKKVDKKVFTSLTLASSLFLGSSSVQAMANPPDEKGKSKDNANRAEVDQTARVHQSPKKVSYHVISSGIRYDARVKAKKADASATGKVYIVQKGDTLSQIAAWHNLSLRAVIEMNQQLQNPNRIYVGQRIRLSGKSDVTISTGKPQKVVAQNQSSSHHYQRTSSRPSSSSSPSGWQQKADAIIQEAQRHLNDQYQYGAEGPNRFDCSGFTSFVFQQNGYSLPRSSSQQAAAGASVAAQELRKGDLLFFDTSGSGVSHVAIYMGDDRMIHATNPETDVTVDSMNESYWKERYVGARRIID